MLIDLKADWTVATTYLNSPGIDNHLRQTSATTGVSYYLTDHLGSTSGLTDTSGNLIEQLTYDSFGNSTGSARTRYTYTGRERDADTGMLYYRARFYDPQVGRFISEDPIGFRGGINFYAYVGNHPTNYIDPLGLWGFGFIGSGSAEAGMGVMGGGLTGSAGAGFFHGPPRHWQDAFDGNSLGAFGSFGAYGGVPDSSARFPSTLGDGDYPSGPNTQTKGVLGAFAGAGGGIFFTNAPAARCLEGPFKTWSLNIGTGPVKFSVQVGVNGNTWIASLTGGPGAGASISGYPTNTWAADNRDFPYPTTSDKSVCDCDK